MVLKTINAGRFELFHKLYPANKEKEQFLKNIRNFYSQLIPL